GRRDAQLPHAGRGRFPQLVALLTRRQVKFGHQFRQSLQRNLVDVLVVALDDLLLVPGEVLHSHWYRLRDSPLASWRRLYYISAESSGASSCVRYCSAFVGPRWPSMAKSPARSAPAGSSCSASPPTTRPRKSTALPRRSPTCGPSRMTPA